MKKRVTLTYDLTVKDYMELNKHSPKNKALSLFLYISFACITLYLNVVSYSLIQHDGFINILLWFLLNAIAFFIIPVAVLQMISKWIIRTQARRIYKKSQGSLNSVQTLTVTYNPIHESLMLGKDNISISLNDPIKIVETKSDYLFYRSWKLALFILPKSHPTDKNYQEKVAYILNEIKSKQGENKKSK